MYFLLIMGREKEGECHQPLIRSMNMGDPDMETFAPDCNMPSDILLNSLFSTVLSSANHQMDQLYITLLSWITTE